MGILTYPIHQEYFKMHGVYTKRVCKIIQENFYKNRKNVKYLATFFHFK